MDKKDFPEKFHKKDIYTCPKCEFVAEGHFWRLKWFCSEDESEDEYDIHSEKWVAHEKLLIKCPHCSYEKAMDPADA